MRLSRRVGVSAIDLINGRGFAALASHKSVYLFDEMRRAGALVNEYTVSIVINCYCLLKRVHFGFALMDIFFRFGFEPNVTAFGNLIRGIFLDSEVADPVKLSKKLLNLRLCEPNDVMILTVVDGLF
ncbi:hypothetical protein C2S53_006801 [Perilla frutescens var. hirtella]|uniref:Pentatricopeptide repeat-containing protein n=1 Tax=Perilla frutescens var. hirtella TaxID=608512 RepID=A0AAD4JC14_PERFH|nr:hypothetical protein C2S53_006801 [Perilla frutescens var. hirtella]